MLIEKEFSCVLLIDVQEKLFPLIHGADELIKRMEWFAKLADHLEVPIVTTEQYPKGLGETVSELKPFMKYPPMEKLSFSVLSDEAIASMIDEMEAEDLLIMGIESHVCVMQSVIELMETDKNIYVVSDCIGARNEVDHLAAINRMNTLGAEIVTKEMVLFEWLRKAGNQQFKTVSKEFLQ